MSTGDFPSTIKGFSFLGQRELPPVSICWDFAVTSDFSIESATELLTNLPEDFALSYFDPDSKQKESWIFIRRAEQKYFMLRAQHGVDRNDGEISLDAVRASFMRSPLVQSLPPQGVKSFTIARIPDR